MKERIRKICLGANQTIKEAMEAMTYKSGTDFPPPGIVLVVADKKLEGIVTDGDIRRGLLGGKTLLDEIGTIMTKDPVVFDASMSYSAILQQLIPKIKSIQKEKLRLRSGKIDQIILVHENKEVEDVISFFDLWSNSEMHNQSICVVGLGFVGLTLAVALADAGFEVTGVDSNARVVDLINSGKSHFHEIGLETMLSHHIGKNFKAVDTKNDIAAQIYIISVGTPLDEKKNPALNHLLSACAWLKDRLKEGDTVILRSTVPIGTTRKIVLPELEKSGLVAGKEFHLVFAPERTIEGKAMEELRQLPQVIGGITKASTRVAADVFSKLTSTIVLLDSLEEAEIVKIINNCFRDTSFAFANEMALLCDNFNIDATKVINAANEGYPRNKVALPSPGVGGMCLKKDPYLLASSCKAVGYKPQLITQSRIVNESMPRYVYNKVKSFCLQHKLDIDTVKIFILGVAFKGDPETDDIRESPTLELLDQFTKKKNISCYDAIVSKENIESLGVKYQDPKEGFDKASIVIIMNNHYSFRKLDIYRHLSKMQNPGFFFDGWHLFSAEEAAQIDGITYATLGHTRH